MDEALRVALGFDEALCPDCKVNLRNGICLNGCGLRRIREFRDAIEKAVVESSGKQEAKE